MGLILRPPPYLQAEDQRRTWRRLTDASERIDEPPSSGARIGRKAMRGLGKVLCRNGGRNLQSQHFRAIVDRLALSYDHCVVHVQTGRACTRFHSVTTHFDA